MSSAASPKISLSPPPSADSPISRQSNLRAQVTFTTPTKSNNNHSTSGAPSPSSSLAFSAYSNPSSPLQSPSSALSDSDELNKHGRGRSSSLLSVHEVQDNYDDQLDQGVGPNLNVDWVDYKGAWVIHLVLIFAGKILVDIIPGITQDVSWTTVNIAYDVVTYIMFHYITGTPFESSGGVYDRLTMWEQIDMGAHYTPTKKWLTILPIALFLLCTHYTHLDLHPSLFTLNFTITFCVALLPKLPVFHRLRFRFLDGVIGWSNAINDERSGPPTPIEEQMRRMPEPDFGYSSGLSPRAAATFIGRAPSPATKLG
ncbi:hypothetical protein MJO28_002074 [Puccinia striiformis f. sp. tritici]|uniref:Uncharacterized protein n=1 Tax=Puccinia striiformis f. sp. tritici TaxID=168172 RepID=A0ACC0EXG7_9BASI|nr:hypothetical protein Pst134EA_002730 [Puccinia striiformis f. sp. tritici]KAH9464298.1 hypothetical protein Pst134EB_003828 [Puccinia striiformis f. sp. tritici]KAH9472104.1 hypothetical protein Pst134EA_002730 [Puccinia striiformis f. sp. tritici]KAI7935237.1 hypothetical protein MJO28_016875 [Puccinia striiformis f. sp. tritici]KAI7961585.1 hypothetical protein MJO28_002074 [Puccinia striiformis f. sp. tritici]